MPNKKIPTNNSPKNRTTRTPRVAAMVPSRMTKAVRTLVVPGAALIGSGLVATAGVLMREQLERVLRAALKSAAASGASVRKVAEEIHMERLLARVGLKTKRRSASAVILGAFAGAIAGSAMTVWVAPMVKRQMESRRAPEMLRKEPMTNNSVHVEPST